MARDGARRRAGARPRLRRRRVGAPTAVRRVAPAARRDLRRARARPGQRRTRGSSRATTRSRSSKPAARTPIVSCAPVPTCATTCARCASASARWIRRRERAGLAGKRGLPQRAGARRRPVRRADQGRLARAPARDRRARRDVHGAERLPRPRRVRRRAAPRCAACATTLAVRAVVAFTAADKLGPGVRRERDAARVGADAVGRRRLSARVEGRRRRQRPAPDDRARPVSRRGSYASTAARSRGSPPIPASCRSTPTPSRSCTTRRRVSCLPATSTGTNPLLPPASATSRSTSRSALGTATFPFTVDVTDSGFDAGVVGTTHPDFHEGGVLANPTRVTYADDFGTDPDATDCGGHGTINAGIVGGMNVATGSAGSTAVEDVDGYNYGLGVAPRARVGGSKIFLCAGGFSLPGDVHGAHDERVQQGRADLDELVGRARRRRLHRRRADLRQARARRRSRDRGQPADGRDLLGRQRRARLATRSARPAPRRTSSRSARRRTSAPASRTAAASRTPVPTTRTTSSTSQAAGRPTTGA